MIRYSGDINGRRTVVFILEPGNITRLMEGRSISVDVGAMVPELGVLDVVVSYADDINAKAAEIIKSAKAQGADIRIERKGPKEPQ